MSITRESLLAKAKPRIESIEIKSLGEAVRLKRFSVRERENILRRLNDPEARDHTAYIVSASLVDEGGGHIFTGDQGIEDLSNLDGAILEDIARAVSKINGIFGSDENEAIEAAEKNLPATTPDDSSLDSPLLSDQPSEN